MFEFKKITTCLGSRIEHNSDIEEAVGWSAEEIFNKTGIKKRYISNDNETVESLALESYKKLQETEDIKDIDLIISVTNTPSVLFPTLAHYIFHNSDIEDAAIIGLNAGCTGYLDCLSIVMDKFENNSSNCALVITSDTYSKNISLDQRSTRTLFSDGASSTLIRKSEEGFKRKRAINTSQKGTFDKLIMRSDNLIKMDGPGVLHFGISKVVKELNEILDNQNPVNIFPHQAGKIMLSTLAKKINSKHTLNLNYEDFGNLVSTSIPNLLKDNFDSLKSSERFLLSGFGVGLSHHSILFSR